MFSFISVDNVLGMKNKRANTVPKTRKLRNITMEHILGYSPILAGAYRAFSPDVIAAMLMFQNKETAAILVYQANPPRIEPYFYAKIVFCFSKPIWPLVT